MGSEKRARQKANRAARREAEAKAARRARTIRLIRNVVVLAAIVMLGSLVVSWLLGLGGDDPATVESLLQW